MPAFQVNRYLSGDDILRSVFSGTALNASLGGDDVLRAVFDGTNRLKVAIEGFSPADYTTTALNDARYLMLSPTGGALQTINGIVAITKDTSALHLTLTNPNAAGFTQFALVNNDGSANFSVYSGGSTAPGTKNGFTGLGSMVFEVLGSTMGFNTRLTPGTQVRRGIFMYRGATGAANVIELFGITQLSDSGEGMLKINRVTVAPIAAPATGAYLWVDAATDHVMIWRHGQVSPTDLTPV